MHRNVLEGCGADPGISGRPRDQDLQMDSDQRKLDGETHSQGTTTVAILTPFPALAESTLKLPVSQSGS